jgi:hypothetical protein
MLSSQRDLMVGLLGFPSLRDLFFKNLQLRFRRGRGIAFSSDHLGGNLRCRRALASSRLARPAPDESKSPQSVPYLRIRCYRVVVLSLCAAMRSDQ